jgi:hypothetical protein
MFVPLLAPSGWKRPPKQEAPPWLSELVAYRLSIAWLSSASNAWGVHDYGDWIDGCFIPGGTMSRAAALELMRACFSQSGPT